MTMIEEWRSCPWYMKIWLVATSIYCVVALGMGLVAAVLAVFA